MPSELPFWLFVLGASHLLACSRTDLVPLEEAIPDAMAASEPDPRSDAGSASADAGAPSACTSPSFAICNDGQIAAVLLAANEAEVALVQAVRGGLTDPTAEAFADKSLTDHALLIEQIEGAVRAAGIDPVASGASAAVTRMAQVEQASLPATAAPGLDGAYMGYEYLAHLQSLGLLDRVLSPGAANVRLADAIAAMRQLEAQHAALAAGDPAVGGGPCGETTDR